MDLSIKNGDFPYITMENWVNMGKSTISTGPFSIELCNKLPEGIYRIFPFKPPFSSSQATLQKRESFVDKVRYGGLWRITSMGIFHIYIYIYVCKLSIYFSIRYILCIYIHIYIYRVCIYIYMYYTYIYI